MRTTSRLTVFTLSDGSTITTRSALETRWAIFFNELRLTWEYEPDYFSSYLPDFKVDGLGYVEIKPTLALLISESSDKIRAAALERLGVKIYAFIGEQVSFNTIALYQGDRIFAPTQDEMGEAFREIRDERFEASQFWFAMNRANRAKLDHFVSVRKVIELERLTAQRKIVREASEQFKQQQNR